MVIFIWELWNVQTIVAVISISLILHLVTTNLFSLAQHAYTSPAL